MTHFFDNAPKGPTSPGLDLGNYAKFRETVTFAAAAVRLCAKNCISKWGQVLVNQEN